MFVDVRAVVLCDFLEEFLGLFFLEPGLFDEKRQLRLDSQLVVDVLPSDVCCLLSDFHSGVLDDLGDLIF